MCAQSPTKMAWTVPHAHDAASLDQALGLFPIAHLASRSWALSASVNGASTRDRECHATIGLGGYGVRERHHFSRRVSEDLVLAAAAHLREDLIAAGTTSRISSSNQ
jgi:hypothetical protein